ncbi:MAG: hypothetical protein LWW97_06470 [Deltaproteobacteria bacterium]|nr:hypothetical protein [Deltaproteobacteria bacterium]
MNPYKILNIDYHADKREIIEAVVGYAGKEIFCSGGGYRSERTYESNYQGRS